MKKCTSTTLPSSLKFDKVLTSSIDLLPLLQTPGSVSHGVSEHRERGRGNGESQNAAKVHRVGLHPSERDLREPLLIHLNHAGAYLPTSESYAYVFIHVLA